MAIIKKKAWPEYFEAILSGKKKYDLRLNDFDAHEGDALILEEWNPETKQYTGRKLEKRITYVGKFGAEWIYKTWSEQEFKDKGLVVLSLE